MERPRSDLWSVNTSDSILTVRALSKSICQPCETAGDGDWRGRQKSALVPEPLTGQPPARLHQLSYRYAAVCGAPAPPTPARAWEFWGTQGLKKIKLNGSFLLSIHILTWFYAGLKASQLHKLPPPVPPSRLPPGQYEAGQLWFVCPVLHHAGLLVNRPVFSLQPRLMWRAAKQCRWIMGGLWSAWAANKARIIHSLRIRLKHVAALNSWSLGEQFTFVVP